MGISYELIESDKGDRGASIWREIVDLTRRYHNNLFSAEVTLQALFASKTDKEGRLSQALMRSGYPIAGTVKICSTSNRVAGLPDAQLIFDKLSWDQMTDRQRRACIDQQLEKLETAYDDEGELKCDDIGRPKLKVRPFDFEAGGFKAVAERHKEHSLEAMQLEHIVNSMGQFAFEFMRDMQPAPNVRELLTDKLAREAKGEPLQ